MAIDERHQRMTARLRSERGVSLIHVAVSIFVLMGFAVFVLDHGVMMLARGQAQNVADSAALSAVITRVKDEPGPAAPAVNGITEKVITHAVDQGTIFGGTPANIGRTWGWTCPPGIPAAAWCAQVNVFRDGTNSSTALPVYFAPLFGLTSQRTRATATAAAQSANGTRCLKPWIIPDKWQENTGPADEFNPPGDVYIPYDYANNIAGTGYTLADIGTTVLLKPGNPHQAISPSFFFEIEEAQSYEEAIVGCEITKIIGDTVNTLPGNRIGPTRQGVDTLTANGPVDVIIAMFSPVEFLNVVNPHGNFDLTIVNMLSVRVSGMHGNDVMGVIIGGAGEIIGPGPTPSGTSSMIYSIRLVR
jgi:hypothetical protein